MLDLGSANSKGESTKSSMSGCMAVSANKSCPGEGKALFWTNDVDNSLSLVIQAKVCEAKLPDILLESNALCS